MILIATDEAGYGPKLGPLVVAASVWQIDDAILADHSRETLQSVFKAYRDPVSVLSSRVIVNDSKAVFQPKKGKAIHSTARPVVPPYHVLQWVTKAGWLAYRGNEATLRLTRDLAGDDHEDLVATPWLNQFASEQIDCNDAAPVVEHWRCQGLRLLNVKARVICASRFNALCDAGLNKSDILGELTLGLVREQLELGFAGDKEAVEVFCDRHGGRRYYAAPLSVGFDDTLVQVISESKVESRYQVPFNKHSFGIRFTVKGDTFTPVAFSSMVAKYLREKAMESFNAYFQSIQVGSESLRPTAGYPVDADRFLEEIAATIKREAIPLRSLTRSR
ncbi:hypothetical protein [Rhodopirellula sp. MGV]|uniref:hypothetical protein n=1 Tax=Rhodopirellula sp. MGV TaxID=2023130 RepID=UPI000B96E031|nr:hypothetical protein [Rhodopirellula sp. MGV]OYP35194.1 hypothetical protein CGZ80_12405 [Rhodopirellula sp. MGV]PNY37792.1 hypothetical protein C2E31_05895 [Rhodopirellula baltica]